MLIRYALKCNHCQKTTLLRLGIGNTERQIFSFECENCAQEISGILHLTKNMDNLSGFDIKGASQIPLIYNDDIFAKVTDFIITIDPDFAYSTSHDDSKLTPFIQASMRNRGHFIDRLDRLAFLDLVAKVGYSDITRIIRNYVTENWPQFEIGVKKYIPDGQSVNSPIDRNRALYQIIELFLSSIVTSSSHIALIRDITNYTANIVSTNSFQFDEFLVAAEKAEYLQDVQHRCLDLIPRFLSLVSEFRPIIIEWDSERPDQELASDLKVKSKISFHDLKSFYVDTYELIFRSITLITALINIVKRGNYNLYASHPTVKNFVAKNIDEFNDKPNAPKIEMLKEEPLFYYWLEKSLDSKLRNAIGHNSIKYNKAKEQIEYSTDKKSRKIATIGYSDFLMKTLRVFIRSHQVNHMVKIIYVHKYLPRKKP